MLSASEMFVLLLGAVIYHWSLNRIINMKIDAVKGEISNAFMLMAMMDRNAELGFRLGQPRLRKLGETRQEADDNDDGDI